MILDRMHTFGNKLLAYGIIASVISTMLTLAVICALEAIELRQVTVKTLTTHAAIIAANSTAALEFQDSAACQETLNGFTAVPGVIHAAVYDDQENLFARYGQAPSQPALSGIAPHFDGLNLMLARPIVHDDRMLGTLVIRYDLSGHYTDLQDKIMMAFAAGLAAMVITVLFAYRLRRHLVTPINDLGKVARRIASTDDYSLRARRYYQDEIGELADVFNTMIERVQAKDERISNLNDRLEKRVLARTRALEDAVEQAEAANRAKSQFLANMSHEIRTPMTAILGFTDVLRSSGNDEEKRQTSIETIERNGQHLLTIINDILDLSKIEAGHLSLEKVRCCPAEILGDVARMMTLRAENKGLTFTVRSQSPIPESIISDPTRLRQILINVIGNAIKFTAQGSVTVSIGMSEQHPSRIWFDVADTGTGIQDDQLSRLFKPFTQADTSTTRKFGGTGLGLTISRRLTRALGGDITITSKQDQGSTFRIEVDTYTPVDELIFTDYNFENLTGDSSSPAETSPSPNSPQALANMRILVAEDGIDNQTLIKLLLKHLGAEVMIVENGRLALEAIDAAGDQPFDVVLMDMQMPEIDGYTATQTLRNKGYTGPIIALTAHAMSGDRKRCIDAGCNDYLIKPIDTSLLLDVITRVAKIDAVDVEMPTFDEELAELYEAFLVEIPERMQAIRSAFDEGDLETTGQIAHKLVGAAGIYGHLDMAQAAAGVDRSVRNAPDDIEVVQGKVDDLIAEIERVLNRTGSPPADAADTPDESTRQSA